MDEFIFHIKEGKPVKVTNKNLAEYVESQKLMLRATTYVPSYLFYSIHSEYGCSEVQKKMTEAISEEVTTRMNWLWHKGISDSTVTGELVVMNMERLKDLLKHFGVIVE